MAEDSSKEGKVGLCLLVLSGGLDERLLDLFRGLDVAVFLAFAGRDLPEDKAAAVRALGRTYVCTYIPTEVPEWAEPSGPLKMLHMCAGKPIMVV